MNSVTFDRTIPLLLQSFIELRPEVHCESIEAIKTSVEEPLRKLNESLQTISNSEQEAISGLSVFKRLELSDLQRKTQSILEKIQRLSSEGSVLSIEHELNDLYAKIGHFEVISWHLSDNTDVSIPLSLINESAVLQTLFKEWTHLDSVEVNLKQTPFLRKEILEKIKEMSFTHEFSLVNSSEAIEILQALDYWQIDTEKYIDSLASHWVKTYSFEEIMQAMHALSNHLPNLVSAVIGKINLVEHVDKLKSTKPAVEKLTAVIRKFSKKLIKKTPLQILKKLDSQGIIQKLSLQEKKEQNLLGEILPHFFKIKSLHIETFQKTLPDCSHLTELKELYLSDCENLEKLPEMKQFKNLESLQIEGCEKLNHISLVEDQKNLQSLRVKRCNSLERISSTELLEQLEELDLSECDSLNTFPPIENSTKLRILILNKCSSLPITIIEKINTLIHLETLELSSWSSLKSLCINQLKKLKSLKIRSCNFLEELSGSISNKLKTIHLTGCNKLKKLPGLDRLSDLIELNISGSPSIEAIPPFHQSSHLETLKASGCTNLKTLPALNELVHLKSLSIERCGKLELDQIVLHQIESQGVKVYK